MSISSTAIRKAGPFTGNGVTTVFPFTFKVFSASDVLVVRTDLSGVETTQVLTTNYTVALNGNQDTTPGGSVTMLVAPPTGFLLTIGSQVLETQPVVLTNNGGFLPTVINDALDRATILVQQLTEVLSRSLTIPFSSSASTSMPAPVANNLIGWNSAANALVNYAGVASAAVSAAMAPVVAAATLLLGRAALGATSIGEALFTAASASAARSAIGVTGPAWKAFRNAVQALTAAVSTEILINEIVYDTVPIVNTSNGHATPNVAGYYNVQAWASTDQSNGGIYVGIAKNGVLQAFSFSPFIAGLGTCASVACEVSCNGTTDYISVLVLSTANCNVSTSAYSMGFSGSLARPA